MYTSFSWVTEYLLHGLCMRMPSVFSLDSTVDTVEAGTYFESHPSCHSSLS